MKTTLKSRKILHQCYQLSSPILPASKALYVTGSRRCTTPFSNLMSFSCRALLFSRNLPFSQNSEPHKQKGPHKVLLNGISSHLVDSLHWGTLQGRDSIKEKKQQMLVKTWKYARLLNTGERTKICNSPKSPREETCMGKIQSNRLNMEEFNVGKETKTGNRPRIRGPE